MSDLRKQTKGKLSDLDEATQLFLFEQLKKGKSYEEMIAWLVQRGLVHSLSDTTLSKWYQREAKRHLDAMRQERWLDISRQIKEEDPAVTGAVLAQVGDIYFTKLAVSDENNKDFVRVQKLINDRKRFEADHNRLLRDFELRERALAQKDEQLANEARRIAVLEQNQAKAKEQLMAVKKDGGLSPESLARIEEAAGLL